MQVIPVLGRLNKTEELKVLVQLGLYREFHTSLRYIAKNFSQKQNKL
jgi:hypothetical protein